MRLKPTQSVEGIRYVAGEAEAIIRLTSAGPIYYMSQIEDSGRIRFRASGSTPTPHTLDGRTIMPGQWLVRAALDEGGVAGDAYWRVWDNEKVLQYFAEVA